MKNKQYDVNVSWDNNCVLGFQLKEEENQIDLDIILSPRIDQMFHQITTIYGISVEDIHNMIDALNKIKNELKVMKQ